MSESCCCPGILGGSLPPSAAGLIGSYLTVRVIFNAATGTYPICSTSPAYRFASEAVLLIGIVTLLLGTTERLTDLQCATSNKDPEK